MILNEDIGTIHVLTKKVDDVARIFEQNATGVERAVVSPLRGSWTSVYPHDADSSRRWAELYSKELKTVCLSFQIIEDQVFCYQLFEKGKLLDEYASKPVFLLGAGIDIPKEKIQSLKGKSETWEPLLINGRECKDVAKLLQTGFDDPHSGSDDCASDYVIPTTILEDLCSMVGIAAAGSNYNDLNDEIQEWMEDVELADEDEEDEEDFGILDCGYHAKDFKLVRAPRRSDRA